MSFSGWHPSAASDFFPRIIATIFPKDGCQMKFTPRAT